MEVRLLIIIYLLSTSILIAQSDSERKIPEEILERSQAIFLKGVAIIEATVVAVEKDGKVWEATLDGPEGSGVSFARKTSERRIYGSDQPIRPMLQVGEIGLWAVRTVANQETMVIRGDVLGRSWPVIKERNAEYNEVLKFLIGQQEKGGLPIFLREDPTSLSKSTPSNTGALGVEPNQPRDPREQLAENEQASLSSRAWGWWVAAVLALITIRFGWLLRSRAQSD